jgi:hypothetical protein
LSLYLALRVIGDGSRTLSIIFKNELIEWTQRHDTGGHRRHNIMGWQKDSTATRW